MGSRRGDLRTRWSWETMTFSIHGVQDDPKGVDLMFTCSRCGTDDYVRVFKGRHVQTAREIRALHKGGPCDEAMAASVLKS